MPSVKISQLPNVTATAGGEVFLVVQDGISKKVTLSSLFTSLKSNTDVTFDVQTAAFKVTNDADVIFSVLGGTTNKVGVGTDVPDTELHVYGSLQTGKSPTIATTIADVVATKPALTITPYEFIGSQSATTTISSSCDTTAIVVESDRSFTLSDGTEGQNKIIILWDIVGTGKVTATTVNGSGWSSFLLNNIGASITLKFVNGKWVVVGSYLATISND